MQTERRSHSRLVSFVLALSLAAVASIGPSSCSGSGERFSGRYQASMEEGRFTLDFQGGNKVKVSIGTADEPDQLSHNCVYTVNGDKITFTTDEPMGAPMTLRIDGDTFTDDSGTVYRKK